MAQYRVELYRNARGYSQVLEFFNTLKRSNPKLLAFAQRLLKNLEEHGPDLRPPLAKPLKGLQAPIWEAAPPFRASALLLAARGHALRRRRGRG